MSKWRLANDLYLWAIIYFGVTTILKWGLAPQLQILLYLTGAVIGLYLLDILEKLFKTPITVLKTVYTQAILTVATVFVLTSSGSLLGSGVVLFINMRYWYLQYRQWVETKSLASWFTAVPQQATQRNYLYAVGIVFGIETLLFVLI